MPFTWRELEVWIYLSIQNDKTKFCPFSFCVSLFFSLSYFSPFLSFANIVFSLSLTVTVIPPPTLQSLSLCLSRPSDSLLNVDQLTECRPPTCATILLKRAAPAGLVFSSAFVFSSHSYSASLLDARS